MHRTPPNKFVTVEEQNRLLILAAVLGVVVIGGIRWLLTPSASHTQTTNWESIPAPDVRMTCWRHTATASVACSTATETSQSAKK